MQEHACCKCLVRHSVLSFVFQGRQLATCSTSFKCIWSLRSPTYMLRQRDLESSFGVLSTARKHGYSCAFDSEMVLLHLLYLWGGAHPPKCTVQEGCTESDD